MRKAFTLVELLVSVVIMFLLVFALTKSLGVIRAAANQSEAKNRQEQNSYQFRKLLTQDFLQATTIAVSNYRDFDIVELGKSTNSLYGRGEATTVYLVSKPDKKLLRLESASKFALPIVRDDLYKIDTLRFDEPISSFKVLVGKKEEGKSCKTVLIFIEYEKKSPLLLELGIINSSAC